MTFWFEFMKCNLAARHPLRGVIHHRPLHGLQFTVERCYQWEGLNHLYESVSGMLIFKLKAELEMNLQISLK